MGFRIWVTGCPVVRREGHVPEHRIRQRELHSRLRVLAPSPIYMGDNTLQRRFCLDVRQSEPLSSVHLRRYENQCTVSTDGPCLSLFFKRRSEDVLPGDPHWDGHQYALTPSAVCREPGGLAGFVKPRCKGCQSPKLRPTSFAAVTLLRR